MIPTLNRRRLNRLNLPPGTIDAVLRLHEQEVAALRDQCSAYRRAADEADACRRERDELQQQLTELQSSTEQTEALRRQLEADRAEAQRQAHRSGAEQAMKAALLAAGANPKALPLLMKDVDLDALTLQQNDDAQPPHIHGEDLLTAELRARYGDFFAEPKQLAVPAVEPPGGLGGMLTAESIRGMDAAQINANWQTVKAALSRSDD